MILMLILFPQAMDRRAQLHDTAKAQRAKLEESQKLQQFLRDVEETRLWIAEKNKSACDESYRVRSQPRLKLLGNCYFVFQQDPTNLQNKLQKHQAFEVELSANKGRVDSVSLAGEKLVSNDHYASDEIKSRIESLQELWKNLLTSSADKRKHLIYSNIKHSFNDIIGQKLQEANEQQQFNR